MKLIGNRIFIRLLSPDDVSEEYVAWLNDPEVNQYLESRFHLQTLDTVRSYVKVMSDSLVDVMFGIFLNDTNEHIGNIKIGSINTFHRFAEVGLIVGNSKMWGRGYASEAIILATKYSFEELQLNKLIAGMYSENTGSLKAFIKSGWQHVGTFHRHYFLRDSFIDKILVEICV
jgi:[ribosomal protein S5]-alanine N-acetyltransferase